MDNNEMIQLLLDKLEILEKGQMTMLRCITQVDQKADRIEKKLDRLSGDVGQVLANITDNVGDELEELKKAK